MSVEPNIHPSWRQVSEKKWAQTYDFQDAFYGRILGEVGSPALFMVNCQIQFTFTTHTDQVADQIRNAWKQMRLAYPIIGTVSEEKERVYEAITSAYDLEKWADETFKIERNLTGADIWRQLKKTRLPTMRFLPNTNEISLQAEHSHLDGRGLIHFWREFVSVLIDPKPLVLGRELANLPGTSDDYLPIQEEYPGQGEKIAMELLQSLEVLSPEKPISYPLQDPSTLSLEKPGFINGHAVHKFSTMDTDRIIAACKRQSVSLTAVYHAAVGFATRDVQRERGVEPGTKFATFSNLDLRRYFQRGGGVASAEKPLLGNFHTILPCIAHYGHHKSFVDVAKELSASYQQSLAAKPGLFSALRPMMQLFGDEFTKGPLLDTTPAISTGGNLDLVLQGPFVGPAGRFTIDDIVAGDVVLGPWMDCFVSIWKGSLALSSNFNGVFYAEEEVHSFLIRVGKHILGGLGLAKVSEAKI